MQGAASRVPTYTISALLAPATAMRTFNRTAIPGNRRWLLLIMAPAISGPDRMVALVKIAAVHEKWLGPLRSGNGMRLLDLAVVLIRETAFLAAKGLGITILRGRIHLPLPTRPPFSARCLFACPGTLGQGGLHLAKWVCTGSVKIPRKV